MQIIEVRNISKKYIIGRQQSYLALRDTLTNILKAPAKWVKEKIFDHDSSNDFWALKDINFEVKRGEVLGIIGGNGAGKSTLLKILSQITPPTTGEIVMRGRVGSLLEVGTGFHPELTGRENIMLNGAILGMKKREIEKKFDEIVEFSGIDKFLDTPVKRYSSGMYVRLAFSVAAHLEPDILIVDEVLSVGDVEFQKKCIGKMKDIATSQDRTVLFVSHNMGAITSLCQRCILLDKGKIKEEGETSKVVESYLNNKFNAQSVIEFPKVQNDQIIKISIYNTDHQFINQIPIDEDFFIETEYYISDEKKKITLSIKFFSEGELLLLSSESDMTGELGDYAPGRYKTTVKIPAYLFNVGIYYFDTILHRPYLESVDAKRQINFEIIDSAGNKKSKVFGGTKHGKIASILNYHTYKLES